MPTAIAYRRASTAEQSKYGEQRWSNSASWGFQYRSAYSGRTLGVLGEPRVNVLGLNLALDKLAAK